MKSIRDYPKEIIFGIPPKLSSKEKCAIDTEIYNMDGDRLHRPVLQDGSPNGKFACATFCFDGKTVYFVTDEKDVSEALHNVNGAVWIFANMKFDVTHLRRWAEIPVRTTKIWDVIAIEKILWASFYFNFSLADLTRRRLHTYMPKDDRMLFADAETHIMTKEMVEYAAFDPIATWHVYQSQRKDITKSDIEIWRDVDLPAINTIMSMKGFKVDVDGWYALADEAKEM